MSKIFICFSGWAKSNNLKLTHPRGWISTSEVFDWEEYLKETRSAPAVFKNSYFEMNAFETGFELGMKLEVVNPEKEYQICAATVANTTRHLLWIHLDSSDWYGYWLLIEIIIQFISLLNL